MIVAQEEAEALEALGELTLIDWLTAGAIVVVSMVLARLVSGLVRRVVQRRSQSGSGGILLGRFAAYVIVVLGFIYALNVVEIPVAPLLGALGLVGLALAFAFQDILENLIAGIGMQIRRPMRPGDEIETNEYEGTVVDVALRTVQLTTFDGETVYLPNSLVWKAPILNATQRSSRRTTLTVGVAYGTDLDRAQRVLVESTANAEGVMASPSPLALVTEFGDSSINFAVRYWHKPHMSQLWQTRDEVARSIKKALDEAGIEIPFPQRTIHYAPDEG